MYQNPNFNYIVSFSDQFNCRMDILQDVRDDSYIVMYYNNVGVFRNKETYKVLPERFSLENIDFDELNK